jgi:hypothetical protein
MTRPRRHPTLLSRWVVRWEMICRTSRYEKIALVVATASGYHYPSIPSGWSRAAGSATYILMHWQGTGHLHTS